MPHKLMTLSVAFWALAQSVFMTPSWAKTPPKTLVVGMVNGPTSFDPRYVGLEPNSQYMEELRFLPLISFDPKGRIKPIVAESIAHDSATQLTVTIRNGVRFALGRALTVDDVIATYNFLLNPPPGSPPVARKNAFALVKEIKKIGPRKVQFLLKEPNIPFVTNLIVGILPREALGEPPEALQGKGYESGPFLLASRQPQEWVLGANPSYAPVAGIQKPRLSSITFRVIQEGATLFAAMVKGDVDLTQRSLSADKVAEIEQNYQNKLKLYKTMGIDTTYLAFSMRHPQFKNVNVRKAVAKSIRRAEILKELLKDQGALAEGMFPPGSPAYEASLKQDSYDPQGAAALLDDVGLVLPRPKKGLLGHFQGPPKRFSIRFKVPMNRERIDVAKAISNQLREVGIEALVEPVDFSVFAKVLNEGLVDMWLAPWSGFKDPDHLHFVFHSSMVPPKGANRGRYVNPKVDALLDQARQETDGQKRFDLYREAQKLLAMDMPYVYLWHRAIIAVAQSSVSGFESYSDGRYLSLVNVDKKL